MAFGPIPVQVARHLLGISNAGVQIISHDCTSSDSYFNNLLRARHPFLSPGLELDALNKACVKIMEASVSRLKDRHTETNLYEWVRHEMLMVTTEATYGPGNPFSKPANESLWK